MIYYSLYGNKDHRLRSTSRLGPNGAYGMGSRPTLALLKVQS